MITRQQALMAGLSQYTGKPCRNCGSMGRYTANGGCTECCNRRAAEARRTPTGEEKRRASANRYRATESGRLTFEGRPCKHCGNTTRYTSNAGCVPCIAGRTERMRAARAELYHSDTSPVKWINEPPAPELAYLYAACPALAAYNGEWHCIYTDAQHLMPGERIYPGCDVFRRPAPLAYMLNDRTHPGHEIARHLAPAYYAALRRFNLKVRRLPAETEEENLARSVRSVTNI